MLIPWTSSLVAAAQETVDVADDGTWTGTITLINEWSADNRMLALSEDQDVDVRPLPLPVTVQYATGRGHEGAVVGLMTLDKVWRDGPRLMGSGRIDLDDPQGAALARKIRNGFFRFVSADIDRVDGRIVCIGSKGEPIDNCDPETAGQDTGELYTQWRIMGAALLAHPAFPEAQIGMNSTDPVLMDDSEEQPPEESMVAAAFQYPGWTPPTDWFRDPELDDVQTITVDSDGRVRGYLAEWNVRHRSYPDRYITPPRSASGYKEFNKRSFPTSEGLVKVGLITMDTGHASLGLNKQAAIKHYDDTGTMAAVVRAGEDSRGIWLAGAVMPYLTDEQRLRLSLSHHSGDWRQEKGGLELIAALAVPHAGFPLTAERKRTEQGDYAIVAAGALPAPSEQNMTLDIAALTDAVLAEQDRRVRAEDALGRIRQARVAMASRRLTRFAASQPVDEPVSEKEIEGDGVELDAEDVEFIATLLDLDTDEVHPVVLTNDEVSDLLSLLEDDEEDDDEQLSITAANWIQKTGTGHLPNYIKRISKHLIKRGMTKSHAIASAVNQVKRWCRGGQNVKADTIAKACAAVAEWNAKRAQARTT